MHTRSTRIPVCIRTTFQHAYALEGCALPCLGDTRGPGVDYANAANPQTRRAASELTETASRTACLSPALGARTRGALAV